MRRASVANWFCTHRGLRCDEEEAKTIEERWHRRELSTRRLSPSSSSLGLCLFFYPLCVAARTTPVDERGEERPSPVPLPFEFNGSAARRGAAGNRKSGFGSRLPCIDAHDLERTARRAGLLDADMHADPQLRERLLLATGKHVCAGRNREALGSPDDPVLTLQDGDRACVRATSRCGEGLYGGNPPPVELQLHKRLRGGISTTVDNSGIPLRRLGRKWG